MFSLLAGILAFFYDLIPNYAVAISLLTLVVLGALTPITLKGTRSMLAMQKLQPEMKRIQEMHKGDREAQNVAMMEFYKEHKINPLSGCLPMLAQLPVLLIMFRVLRGLTHVTIGDGKKAVLLSKGFKVGEQISDGIHKIVLPKGLKVGTPSYLGHDTALYKALETSKGKLLSFGVDFGATPTQNGRGAVVLYTLIGLVVITSFWQVRQMTQRSAQDAPPQMQMMNRIQPFFSGFISLNLPGGVTLYFLISNLFRVTQQSLMYRFDPHLKSHLAEVKEVRSRAASQPPQPKKGLFSSLKEQAEEREANRRGASNGKSAGSAPVPTTSRAQSGRVTQPGQRGNAQQRKRNKKKR